MGMPEKRVLLWLVSMQVERIANLIINRTINSCNSIIGTIDSMIEEGEIDSAFFLQNETDILEIIDDAQFECEVCSWNCPTESMSCHPGICEECLDEDEE